MSTFRIYFGSAFFAAAVPVITSCSGARNGAMPPALSPAAATSTLPPRIVDGKCTQIAMKPIGTEPFVEGASSHYTIAGPQSEKFMATAENANGIPVPSSSNEPVSLTPIGESNFDIKALGNNKFSLTPRSAPFLGPTRIVPSAPECSDVKSTLAQNPIVFDLASLVYIADVYANKIRVYDGNGNAIPLTNAFSNALVGPPTNDLAYDPYLERLYVPLGDGVGAYDLSGNPITVSGVFPSIDGDIGDAFDTTNRELFVGDVAGIIEEPSVTVYDENGNLLLTDTSAATLNGPFSLTYDAHAHHVYARTANATVLVLGDNGSEVASPGGFPGAGGLYGITFNPLDNLIYVPTFSLRAPLNSGSINIYDENGNPVTAPVGAFQGIQIPEGIAVDTFTKITYVTSCPNILQNNNLPGLVTVYDQAGTQQTLASSAFSNLNCPDAITVVSP